MYFIKEVPEVIYLFLYIELKKLILLVFYLVTSASVIPIVVSRLFYSSGPRLSGGLNTLRRRSYNIVYYY